MAQPRPSMTLILDIDERLDSEDLRLEIDRCYAYVGATVVRTHPAPANGGEPENTLRMLVKLGTRTYLDSTAEGADALWNDVMERWFYNALHKVGNNLLIFNRRQREVGNPDLVFAWIEVQLQNGALSAMMHCNDVGGIAPEASKMLTALRDAYNAGSLGEAASVARVWMPSRESWDAQYAAGMEAAAAAKAAAEAERAAAEAEAAERAAAAEAEAEAAFLESPELVAAASGEDAGAEASLSTGGGVEDVEDLYALDEPAFAVDYRTWTVEYTNGTTATYEVA